MNKYDNPWLQSSKQGRFQNLCYFAMWQLAKGGYVPFDSVTALGRKLNDAVSALSKNHSDEECKHFIWNVSKNMRRVCITLRNEFERMENEV